MKPRTQLQKDAVRLSARLKPISTKDFQYGCKKTFGYVALRRSSGTHNCMECGHSWTETKQLKQVRCPHCGKLLTIKDSNKSKLEEHSFFCVMTVQEDYQVLRHMYIMCRKFVGAPARFYGEETTRLYIDRKGNYAAISYPPKMYWYRHKNPFDSYKDMQLRQYSGWMCSGDFYDVGSEYSLIKKLRDDLKQRGYRETYASQLQTIKRILTSPKHETLIKANMIGVFSLRNEDIEKYWSSIKICLRNKYNPSDARMWRDMLHDLERLGKDLRSPKYVCPEDLVAAHNRWNGIIRRQDEERRRRERRERELEELRTDKQREKDFYKYKSMFFGIKIVKNDIQLMVLNSIEEYKKEGDVMHHCVFSNRYYGEKDSLVLRAIVGGVHMATVELSLKDYKVLQCRGKHNSKPERYDDIVGLVESSKSLFVEARKKKPVRARKGA